MSFQDVDVLYVIAAVVLILHFIGDFVLQSHWMASNKSKRFDALLLHVGLYSLTLAIIPAIMWIVSLIDWKYAIIYVLANFFIHLVIDFTTSKVTSKLWMKQDWHNFFVVIGFDQLLHAITLLATTALLLESIKTDTSPIFSLTFL